MNTNTQESENSKHSKQKINLPNKLTIIRIILVPVVMILILVPIPAVWAKILAASVFVLASLTDLIDGIIARRFNLITDFGKLMDPLADKFMIVGALIAIIASDLFSQIRMFAACLTAIVFFRELAVTSLRLVANTTDDNVIAAHFVGKLKFFSQCVCITTILLESIVITSHLNTPEYLFSYITMAFMAIITIYSGIVYFKTYWAYIDPTK